MIRSIDDLGRVCLPKSYRKELGIEEYDELKMELVDRKIIISKVDDIDYKAIIDEIREYAIQNEGTNKMFQDVIDDLLYIINKGANNE